SLPERIEPRLAQRIAAAAASRRIAIAAVSGTFNMIDPIPERRHAGLRCLGQLAGACALLGARIITLCTGTRDPDDMWRGHPANPPPGRGGGPPRGRERAPPPRGGPPPRAGGGRGAANRRNSPPQGAPAARRAAPPAPEDHPRPGHPLPRRGPAVPAP